MVNPFAHVLWKEVCCTHLYSQALHEREKLAAPERIEQMLQLVGAQREKERVLQDRYAALLADKAELSSAMEVAQ